MPTALIVATTRWFPTARLAMAMSAAGFQVETVCSANHPIMMTSIGHKTFRYHPLLPLRSLRQSIRATTPDLVLAADDLAARHLHTLHAVEHRRGDREIPRLIERSMGASESFSIVYDRAASMQVAGEEGVRVAKTKALRTSDDMKAWVLRMGLPAVLKANGTSGGVGVRVVRTIEEAVSAFQVLRAPPLLARAAKRAFINDDWALLKPSLLRQGSVVNGQEFIEGREGTSVFACWEGTVLAALHFEVLEKRDSFGPATVVRVIDNDDMSKAACKIARRLKLSGIHGLDFMFKKDVQIPYLIEINPRATQLGHLTLGAGRDIPVALAGVLSGVSVEASPELTRNDTIAIFPHEWIRDPRSRYLRSAYHDVPWQEPGLVEACIRSSRKQKKWYGRTTTPPLSYNM
jgi:formate-dependent phosphoribosylglycinamide formyltransferase (GAR transformylase)